MTLDKSEELVNMYSRLLGREPMPMAYRMSELGGYTVTEMGIAIQLQAAFEYQAYGHKPSSSTKFEERLHTYRSGARLLMKFLPNSEFDKLAHLSNQDRDDALCMLTSDLMFGEAEPLGEFKGIDIDSFLDYCRQIGANDSLYWQKIYTHLGLPYEPNSPCGRPKLVDYAGGAPQVKVPTNIEVSSNKDDSGGNLGLVVVAVVVILVILSVIFG